MNSEECSITEDSSSRLERGQRGKSCDFLESGMISTLMYGIEQRMERCLWRTWLCSISVSKKKLSMDKYLSGYEKTKYLYEKELCEFQKIFKGLFL